jgi:hypothetical protein
MARLCPAINKKDTRVHICPHCQKLGISSFDAMGGAGFSRGLVSCRYCHNVSKRRARPLFYLAMPTGLVLFWAMVYFGNPPFPFIYFWLAFFSYLGLLIADRCVELDKYQPREKLPDPRTTIVQQRDSASTTS